MYYIHRNKKTGKWYWTLKNHTHIYHTSKLYDRELNCVQNLNRFLRLVDSDTLVLYAKETMDFKVGWYFRSI